MDPLAVFRMSRFFTPRKARFSFAGDKRVGGDFAVFLGIGGSSLIGGRCRWGSMTERAEPEKEDDRAVEDERADEFVDMVGRDDC